MRIMELKLELNKMQLFNQPFIVNVVQNCSKLLGEILIKNTYLIHWMEMYLWRNMTIKPKMSANEQ